MVNKIPYSAEINKSVEKGLDFLKSNQLPSGEFKSYRSTDPTMETDCEFDSSPFPTALISYSLGFSDSPVAKKMLEQTIRFFINEMEGQSVWRYWTAQHTYHKNIPPDLDDIACVSSVLEQNGVEFPANRKLILANRNQEGLFYTWLVPRFAFPLETSYWRVVLKEAPKPLRLYYFWKLNESAPDDIDCVVNANVLFYLGETEQTKSVVEYLIKVVEQEKESCCDKWHLNRFTFYYKVSRNYFAGVKSLEKAREIIINRVSGAVRENGMIGENVLETALAICTLINLKVASDFIEKPVKFLIENQKDTGEWQKIPMYYGGPKKYFGWGSEELTTGFCLEALIRYQKK